MSAHLTDEQVAAAALSDADAVVQRHLAECDDCQREVDGLGEALAGYAQASRAEAARPERFWTRLQADRHERRRLAGMRSWGVWSAAAAAGLALAALMGTSRPTSKAPTVAADPDHELLLSVERSLRRDVPSALEPVQLLVADMNDGHR
jgi:predicted anti-sigma-YlaC factor YlaD